MRRSCNVNMGVQVLVGGMGRSITYRGPGIGGGYRRKYYLETGKDKHSNKAYYEPPHPSVDHLPSVNHLPPPHHNISTLAHNHHVYHY